MSKNAKSNKGNKGNKKDTSKKAIKKSINPKSVQQSKSVKEEDSHPQARMVKVVFVNGTSLMLPICYNKDEIQLQSDITTARAWTDKAFKVAGSRASKMNEKFGFDFTDSEI